MKAKKILATCLAVAMMLSAAALPTSASEVPQVSSSIASTTVAPRNVQRNWTNLSIGTSYTYLDTGNNYKISNWMALMQLLFLKTKVPAIPLHYESQIMTKTETNSILTSKTSLATAGALR